MFANLVAVLPNVKSGKLRGLATTGAARPRALSEIPTVVEAGVPGYVMTSWFGLLAPRGTPPEAITKLNSVLVQVMQERDMAEKVAADGADPAPSRPDEFARLIAAELKIWGQIIRIANVQPKKKKKPRHAYRTHNARSRDVLRGRRVHRSVDAA